MSTNIFHLIQSRQGLKLGKFQNKLSFLKQKFFLVVFLIILITFMEGMATFKVYCKSILPEKHELLNFLSSSFAWPIILTFPVKYCYQFVIFEMCMFKYGVLYVYL